LRHDARISRHKPINSVKGRQLKRIIRRRKTTENSWRLIPKYIWGTAFLEETPQHRGDVTEQSQFAANDIIIKICPPKEKRGEAVDMENYDVKIKGGRGGDTRGVTGRISGQIRYSVNPYIHFFVIHSRAQNVGMAEKVERAEDRGAVSLSNRYFFGAPHTPM
jgi:hypothetical protein